MRGERNSETGLALIDRKLIPLREPVPHGLLWVMVVWGQLMLAAEGLCGALVTGLSLEVDRQILYPVIGILCLAGTLFFHTEKLNGYRLYGIIAFFAADALLMFFTQAVFLTGARQMGSGILRCIKMRYGGQFQIPYAEGDHHTLTVFLLEVFLLVVLWMSAVIVYRADALLFHLLLFPALALLLLAGGTPSGWSMCLLLFAVLTVLVSSRSIRRKRLWGEQGSEQFEKNLIRHHNVRTGTILLLCGAGLPLALAGFFGIRPVLNLHLFGAEHYTTRIEGQAIGMMIDLLPKISGGRWNLQMDTVGGGVTDGSFGVSEGYELQGVEELKLTCSVKPRETIYLKGYVGSSYTGDSWLSPEAETFEKAAGNWKTEGDPGLYIQNLPFLRILYTEQNADSSRMQQLMVERINANPNYTYFPYYSYLNEYYDVNGDGFAAGQTLQDDLFSFYMRSDYRESIRAWNEDEDSVSVLDRLESSYAAYVKSHYLDIPEGFEELEQQCGEQELDAENVEEISRYIRVFLTTGYSYSMDAPLAPEGEDVIRYFLYESKTGYSIHYASAAVLMFRMFGIPARYVVGYAAPQNLFTAQADGTYTAVLQDDNSQAWAEIYVIGEGWTPVEMTPGAIGTAEEVEYVGDQMMVPEESPEPDTEALEDQKKESGGISSVSWIKAYGKALLVLAVLLAAASVLLTVLLRIIFRYRREYGLDGRRSPKQRVLEIFRAYYRKMKKHGMPDQVESTSLEFSEWVKRLHPSLKEEEYARMMELVLQSCFGNAPITEGDVVWMRNVYKGLKRRKFADTE